MMAAREKVRKGSTATNSERKKSSLSLSGSAENNNQGFVNYAAAIEDESTMSETEKNLRQRMKVTTDWIVGKE